MSENSTAALARATIGIITALEKEHQAVTTVFGCGTKIFFAPGKKVSIPYSLAEVQTLSGNTITVVVGCLVLMGNNNAAAGVVQMSNACPNLRHIIMTGIAGAVPNLHNAEEHVRLGDVVVSDAHGIVQYDLQKETEEGTENRSLPHRPAAELIVAARGVPIGVVGDPLAWEAEIVAFCKTMGELWARPDKDEDRCEDTLLEADGSVPSLPLRPEVDAGSEHPLDAQRTPGRPRVFFGPIASSNTLLKKAPRRDELRKIYGVKAVEMEGAGVVDGTWLEGIGYLVVRGTCDYCDRNKGNKWQNYAAVIAAVYTRHVVTRLEGTPVPATPPPLGAQAATAAGAVTPAVIYATTGAVVQTFQNSRIDHLTIEQANPRTAQAVEKVDARLGAMQSAMEKMLEKLGQETTAPMGPSEEDIALYRERTASLVEQLQKARENFDLEDVVPLASKTASWLRGHQAYLPLETRKEAWMELVACEIYRQNVRKSEGHSLDRLAIDRLLKEYDNA